MESETNTQPSWLDRPVFSSFPQLKIETLLVALILILAVVSRFYNVDLRVMSHDETNHVVPSYDFFMGKGYRHDPVTHGPMQFHLLALSYFLFGDNDLSSRIPAVLFSIATVAVVLFGFRRYLGRSGALIAGLLFLISPFMLFYGRYTRNEAFVALFGVLMFYSVFRYLEKRDKTSLFILTASIALHFITKETVYIYMAQLLLFLAALFLAEVARMESHNDRAKRLLITFTVLSLALLMVALGAAAYTAATAPKGTPSDGNQPAPVLTTTMKPWEQVLLYGGALGFLVFGVLAIVNLIRTFGWEGIRHLRSFDLLILVGTLVLPQLAPFPTKLVGWDPLDYTTAGMLRTGVFIAVLGAISVVIGLWWNPQIWLANAAIFYSIFTVFYTTFFTNGRGFWTGLVGALGYWLAQQGVQRGSQPLYYYALVQVPIYEYLAALGTILAVYFGIRYNRWANVPGPSPSGPQDVVDLVPVGAGAQVYDSTDVIDAELVNAETGVGAQGENPEGEQDAEAPVASPRFMQQYQPRIPVLAMLAFWSVSALLAYSIAGEKMPWLTVHIALPMLLAAGWGLGYLVDTTPWKRVSGWRGVVALLLVPVFLSSMAATFGALLGGNPPFSGNELAQLEATNTFIISLIAFVLSGAGMVWLLNDWRGRDIVRLVTVAFFALLAVLTARAAYLASYVNYDTALEYLVYAHAARGPKDILEQVEEISQRVTGGKDIAIAYDNDALYPYWWYLRDYPNHRWFTDKPTRDLRDVPLLIASETNYGKMDPIVQDNYIVFDYMRLWWPNQDYYNLNWERIRSAVTNPEMRAAIFDIWLNRDYSAYAKLTNSENLTLNNWQPSSRFRFYVRKDIVSQIWNYGATPAITVSQEPDPYEGKITQILPDAVFGQPGNGAGQLNKPRGIRVASDGSIYVADSANHRVQRFDPEGQLITSWGTYGETTQAGAPANGAFNEPWDVAIGPDGSIYVTDTWNHRIQKFTPDGDFLTVWGRFGQGEDPFALWGPRGLAVDRDGNVYVTDTGNKRVVKYTANGEYITQFGTAGMDPGQLDEPVGLAVDLSGNVYVADTWNQRIQVFKPDSTGKDYTVLFSWDVDAWSGQSLDNKPFLAVDQAGHVFITDPEGYRVLEFNLDGSIVRGWGDYSIETDGFGLPSGITVDEQGRVWVSDAGNHRLLRYSMPNP